MGNEPSNPRPAEQPAVRTTIVGGRPPGSGKDLGDTPRGIEVLLIEASVDPDFRKLLTEKRADAAKEIGLDLTPAEAAMLNGIPEAQLELIIRETRVSKKLRAQRRKRIAGVALAALGVGAAKLGCDRWVEYEREKHKPYTICTIAGAIRVTHTLTPPRAATLPQRLLGEGVSDDPAGWGERQAKDLSSDGQ